MSPAPGRSRVFFALWPDAEVRRRLHALARDLHTRLGGRLSRADSLHLTLLFVGEVEDDRLATLQGAAGRVEGRAFEMVLDQVSCWRHNRIAHAGPSSAPVPLLQLVDALGKALREAEIPCDARPFQAHVTLLRKADCMQFPAAKENPALPPILWSARDFVLVRSSLRPEGARYEQLTGWPLR